MFVTLSECPFCDGDLSLEVDRGLVRFGGSPGGGPCDHIVAFYGELEEGTEGTCADRHRFWVWARDSVPLTYYRLIERTHPLIRHLTSYLLDLALKEPWALLPPVPLEISGGTSLDRQMYGPGAGRFLLERPGESPRECALYHWSFYSRRPGRFTAALPNLLRRRKYRTC